MALDLIKPRKLKRGDKIATVSLSWGGAGDAEILWRYNQGKERLENEFGLVVVEMENTLKGSDFVYKHPEKRAEDLMDAFRDPEIKGIFSCIGGDESIRLLPYIDFNVIRSNPKIFIGYSDSTISHLFCLKAGISSFYGPSILAEFAENVEMFEYTKKAVLRTLFDDKNVGLDGSFGIDEPIGIIKPSDGWTSETLPWTIENKDKTRKLIPNSGYELLQGKGVVQGTLIGGCIEVLEMAKGSDIWPEKEKWEDSIIFFETSEAKPEPIYLECWLRSYGTLGILQKAKALIFGKPYENCYYEEYKKVIIKVVREELGLSELPIMLNMNFGHTAPMMILPYGTIAEIDCERVEFSIIKDEIPRYRRKKIKLENVEL